MFDVFGESGGIAAQSCTPPKGRERITFIRQCRPIVSPSTRYCPTPARREGRTTSDMRTMLVAMEVKRAAVERLLSGESGATIAAEVGCSRCRVYCWRDQWRKRGEEWMELGDRRRRRRWGPAGSAEREAELERPDRAAAGGAGFFREALRRIDQARRPTVGLRAPLRGSSSAPGRLVRKAG
jgi:transposase